MARNNLDRRFGEDMVDDLRKKNRILELIVGLLVKDKEVLLKKELENSEGNVVLQETKFSINILQKISANLLNNKEEKSLECLCGLLKSIGNKLKCEDVDFKNVLDEMEQIVEETYPIPVNKGFYVTSISKDTPIIKPLLSLNDNKDETDRAVFQTNQMVLTKNDVNAKVAVEKALNDIRSTLPYKPGQWAPDHQDGKKQYDADFLLALKDSPASKQKPPNIPDCVFQDESNRQMDGRLSMGGRTDFDNPPFPTFGRGKSDSQRERQMDGRLSMGGRTDFDNPPFPTFGRGKSDSQRESMPKPNEEQIQRRILNSLDEYLAGCCTTDEYYEEIVACVSPSDYSKIVYECYNHVLEKSQLVRLKTGELFAKLIKTEKFSIDSFIIGFEELLGLWEDLVIDMPQIWQYFAEGLAPLCLEEVLPVNRLHKLLDSLISNHVGQKLLKPLFGIIVKEKGPNFLHNTWQNSGMQLSDFMSSSEVQLFVKENNFEFLIGGKVPVGQVPLSYEEMQSKLSEFFKSKTPFDDIVNWISANVGDGVKENKFIRTLATAIFQDSISKNKLVPEVLISHTKLIQKYVDNNTDYELQCLYALQSLAHKLEHPQELLLSICDKLYEDSTFGQESFIAWESSTDPAEQEGKGVALKQLSSFIIQLKENDEDDDYSSNSEDA